MGRGYDDQNQNRQGDDGSTLDTQPPPVCHIYELNVQQPLSLLEWKVLKHLVLQVTTVEAHRPNKLDQPSAEDPTID